jgi:hypothetical protein
VNPERDRDRLLEDALEHELRAAAMPPATGACLDAETAAAWADGGLDAHGMAMVESHAAGCARCQAVLAAIARTPQLAVAAEPQASRLWRWWFAPLAATAAAVTVWMVVPQNRLTAPPAPAPVESAATDLAKSNAPVEVTQAAPAAPPETRNQTGIGRDRADSTANRAEAAAPKQETQSFGARERAAEAAKVADAAAEGRVAATAPAPPAPAAPAVALRKQVDPVADATARSSPSPRVIWLVGRGGTVHRSIDGRTFTPVPFPETVDLTAVTASDERRATVTTVDGRRFETEDAGLTWRRLQEISASPF